MPLLAAQAITYATVMPKISARRTQEKVNTQIQNSESRILNVDPRSKNRATALLFHFVHWTLDIGHWTPVQARGRHWSLNCPYCPARAMNPSPPTLTAIPIMTTATSNRNVFGLACLVAQIPPSLAPRRAAPASRMAGRRGKSAVGR